MSDDPLRILREAAALLGTSDAGNGSDVSDELNVGSLILEDVHDFFCRFVVVVEVQADALTLWTAHTYVFDAFSVTPYLTVNSAEKRSGKTRLLEVLELLVHEPLPTANISDAALFRVIAEKRPTLLVDEVDGIFGKKARDREELRGLLCAGYRRGALAHRMGGSNNTTLQTFPVYSPKAFAGIGDCLPDTILDRAIPVRLKRRTRDEKIERFRFRDVEPTGHGLRDRLADWLEPNLDCLAAHRPQLPDELDDRAQDVWEPLLAIADLAGGDWPERARKAALALSTGEEREDESLTVRLLHDIHSVFSANGDTPVHTADLLASISEIEESPWGDWYGKPLSPHGLARLLKPYRIKTMPVWVDGKTVKGYKPSQFADAFARVLGVRRVRTVRSESRSQAAPNRPNPPNPGDAKRRDVFPLAGDDDYPPFVAAKHREGHITLDEAEQLLRLHELLTAAT